MKDFQPLPKNKKVIVTEQDMNQWMAAHYGVSLDRIPMSKPHNMSRTIYERLKKQMLSRQGSKNELEKRNANEIDA